MLHGCDKGIAVLAVVVGWLVCAACAAADTRTWIGGAGNDWHDPALWVPAVVPGPADHAVIAAGIPVISGADATVGSIALDSGLQIQAGRTLTIAGPATSTWTGGNIAMFGAATVVNAGTLQMTGDGVFVTNGGGAGPFRFHNLGAIQSTGSGSGIGVELENDGALSVPSGSLAQASAAASSPESGGSFVAGGTLSLGNIHMGAGSTATGSGTMRFAGGTSTIDTDGYAVDGTTLLSGGELVFNGDGSTGALRFDTFATRRGTGTLTVGSGASRLGDSASFTDSGVTAFTSGSSTVIDGAVQLTSPVAGHTLHFAGTTTWSAGNMTIFDAGTVENAGNLDVTGDDVHMDVSTAGGTPGPRRFHNLAGGVVERTSAAIGGPASGVLADVENDGTIRVLTGTYVLAGTAPSPASSNGAFVAEGPGVLTIGGVVMGSGATATGTGTLRFAGAPTTVATTGYAISGTTAIGDSGELILNADAGTGALRFDGFATRRGTGTLTVGSGASRLGDSATFADAGTTRFTSGSQLAIDGNVQLLAPTAGHTLRLGGTVNWSDGNIAVFDAGSVENAGALEVGGSDVHVTTSTAGGTPGPIAFRNLAGGSIAVAGGTSLGTGPGLTLDGGSVGGSGTLTGPVDNPGGTISPAGVLTISGDYMQGAGGRLRIDVGADRLAVGGTAALDGTLELITGSAPAPTETFRVLDAGSRTGTFATIAGAQATRDRRYLPTYDATGVTLGVGLGPANTSQPSIPATARPGDAVTCDPGSWTGAPSLTFAWMRDGVVVATGQTYTLVAADGGRSIVCRVTGSNADGSADALSNSLVPAAPQEGPPPPETGETFNVEAERGKVTVRLPDGRTVSIDEAAQIESGSVIDTRKGAVRLTSEGKGGRLDTGVFSEGLFKVTQTRGRNPVTELTLVEKLAPCSKGATAAAKKKRRRKRRLWGDADGSYRTRGKYGNAINDGTRWLTEDRCDGTLFRVTRGKILVRRNGKKKAVRVPAGRSHLVRAR